MSFSKAQHVSFVELCHQSQSNLKCQDDFRSAFPKSTGCFSDIFPSDRTMALGSTQPLMKMSTRNFCWG